MRKLPRSSQRKNLSSLMPDLMLTNLEERVKNKKKKKKKKKKGVTEEMETAPWLWGSVDSSWPGVQI